MPRKIKKQNKPYDDAFKLLAAQDAAALLVLLGEIEPDEQVEITPLGRELRVSTRLPDQAYKVVTAAGARVAHIEAQTKYPQVMPDRMADYGVREWLQNHLPVVCYVLLLTDEGLPERPPTVGRIDAGDVQIIVRYRLIRLSQISAARMLRLGRANLLPFVPLMRGDETTLAVGARRVGQIEDEQQRLQLGFDFLVLGGLRYNPADLLDLIGRESMIPLEILKESPTYEFLINEGKDRWKAEGKIEGERRGERRGERKGERKGELKATAEMLRLLIARRFPKLNVTPRIKRLNDAALMRQLGLEVLDMPDAAALRQRLDEAIKAQSRQ